MHIWQSLKALKTSKIWKYTPPKNISSEDLKVFKANERDYKYTMLGVIKKEKQVEAKKK